MPNRNGTGPTGQGPGTGRGMGACRRNNNGGFNSNNRRGCGGGRGHGRWSGIEDQARGDNPEVLAANPAGSFEQRPAEEPVSAEMKNNDVPSEHEQNV